MERGSSNYRLYVKYNSDNPAKVRSLESLLDKGYNGLADSVVSKWIKGVVEKEVERKDQIRVNQNGVTTWM